MIVQGGPDSLHRTPKSPASWLSGKPRGYRKECFARNSLRISRRLDLGAGGISQRPAFCAVSWDCIRPVQGSRGAGTSGAPLACVRPVRLGRAPPPSVLGDPVCWCFPRVRVPPRPQAENAEFEWFLHAIWIFAVADWDQRGGLPLRVGTKGGVCRCGLGPKRGFAVAD